MMQKLKRCRKLLIKWSRKAVPNNKRVINKVLNKITRIQENDFTIEGYKEVKRLTEELRNVW